MLNQRNSLLVKNFFMLSRRFAIILSGSIWLVAGLFLLFKGFSHLVLALHVLSDHKDLPLVLIPFLSSWAGSLQKGIIALLGTSLLLGFLKGRFILNRSAKRIVKHICSLPPTFPLKDLYPKTYYFLLPLMIAFGFGLKLTRVPLDVKGGIDSFVGVALISGAVFYFQAAFPLSRGKESEARCKIERSDTEK